MNNGHPLFISDLHFGHKFIAELRGFSSIQEHDEMIIDRWNSVVKQRDRLVFIAGDFTMENYNNYDKIDRLMGRKVAIMGNHDLGKHCRNLLEYVESVSGCIKYGAFWITHFPIHPAELRGKINIHGHVHEQTINDDRYINISADVIDLTPKTLEELLERHRIRFPFKSQE